MIGFLGGHAKIYRYALVVKYSLNMYLINLSLKTSTKETDATPLSLSRARAPPLTHTHTIRVQYKNTILRTN